jgi:hypothetical protein
MDKDVIHEAREQTAQYLKYKYQDDYKAVSKPDLINMGQMVWDIAYADEPGIDDDAVLQKIYAILHEKKNQLTEDVRFALSAMILMPEQQITSLGAGRWFHQGLPVIRMGHKYAAALMATNPGKQLEDLKPPWRAFVIELPLGLLTIYDNHSDQRVNATFILVHHVFSQKKGYVWTYIAFTESRISMWDHGRSTDQLLGKLREDNKWDTSSFVFKPDEEDERVSELIFRLIINTCLATSGKDRQLKKVGTGHRLHDSSCDNRPPVQRVFQLGKPIKLDCREAVRAYIEGRKKTQLSVQTLVMGHWKRQVHGPQRSLRKWLWLEPYWRGPEDAPIMQRPHDMEDT